MKKLNLFLLSVLVLFIFGMNVNAACDSAKEEELREWATKTEVAFTLSSGEYESQYAYFLSVTPKRDMDYVLEVSDPYNQSDKGKYYEDLDLYAVGCYTNIKEMTYTVKLYSKCSNELLKTLTYTVPEQNRMIHTGMCEKYPEHDLCKPFTNETKDMTEAEFYEVMKEYDDSQDTTTFGGKILNIIRDYGIFILIPFLFITLYYIIKIQEFKKKERKK